LHINLSDIDWPSEIQEGLNKLNIALDATFVLYIIGIAASGLAILASLLALLLASSRIISFGNWGIASIAATCLIIASVMVTIIQSEVTKLINKYGNQVGVYAYRGGKYLAITWVAAVVMLLAGTWWVMELCMERRNKEREYTEKPSRAIWGRGRHSDPAQLRRSGV